MSARFGFYNSIEWNETRIMKYHKLTWNILLKRAIKRKNIQLTEWQNTTNLTFEYPAMLSDENFGFKYYNRDHLTNDWTKLQICIAIFIPTSFLFIMCILCLCFLLPHKVWEYKCRIVRDIIDAQEMTMKQKRIAEASGVLWVPPPEVPPTKSMSDHFIKWLNARRDDGRRGIHLLAVRCRIRKRDDGRVIFKKGSRKVICRTTRGTEHQFVEIRISDNDDIDEEVSIHLPQESDVDDDTTVYGDSALSKAPSAISSTNEVKIEVHRQQCPINIPSIQIHPYRSESSDFISLRYDNESIFIDNHLVSTVSLPDLTLSSLDCPDRTCSEPNVSIV